MLFHSSTQLHLRGTDMFTALTFVLTALATGYFIRLHLSFPFCQVKPMNLQI